MLKIFIPYTAAHVSGAVALILEEFPELSPSEVKEELIRFGTRNVLDEDDLNGTPNLLLYSFAEADDDAPTFFPTKDTFVPTTPVPSYVPTTTTPVSEMVSDIFDLTWPNVYPLILDDA